MQEEKSIPLIKPIEFGGQTYAELNLREPTAGELSEATTAGRGNDVDFVIALIAAIAEVPEEVAQKLGNRDLQKCSTFFARFSQSGDTARAPEQEEKTFTPSTPLKLGNVAYEQLNLREPTAIELSKATRAGGANGFEVAISLISQVAGVPKKVVGALGQRDFQECNDFLGSF